MVSVEQIFHNLNHQQRIRVVDLTLPGIECFLRDVLAKENLSEEGESLRCRYLNILQDNSTGGLQDDSIDDISESNPLKIPQVKETIPPFNEGREIDDYQDETNTDHADNDEDKPPTRSRTARKGTDSTEESGVFFGTQYLASVSSEGQDASNHRHSDTFESISSRDTFMSDSEVEFLEWDLMEDGYSTGDNMDMISPNMNIQPNELGELYAGVLYIREQPGWHKRWFILTETCLKCYKYKSDEKMLFEIPLRDARFVSTDRKRSRMYAITLSIARLKEDITFATADEKSRQEWVYAINHVIKQLTLTESATSSSELSGNRSNERVSTLGQTDSTISISQDNSELFKRNTWHCESDRVKGVLDQFRDDGEEESSDLDATLCPSLAQEESFKELQQCLPDILQRPKSKSWKGDLSKTNDVQLNTASRKSISFSQDLDSQGNCDSSSLPRVKRHGSLANSLANKAARVRSKLNTTSFFKKGKKDEKGYQESSSHSTTFSGYLTRKKAGVWKNRWCVVKDKSLHCYKDFGANLPELELTLEGCVVESLPDREGEKPYSFVLTADKDRLQFAAENDADLEEWLEVLEKEVLKSEGEDVDDDINNQAIPPIVTSQEPQQSDQPTDTNVLEKETKKSSKSGKEKEKSDKDSAKRRNFLGTIANRLGKHSSKSKESQEQKLDDLRKQIDGLDIDYQTDDNSDEAGPSMEGVLYRQYGNKYIECKVKLSDHKLEIEPRELSVDVKVEPTKFRLINCIVLDCMDTEGPLVMVVKRNIGEPLYLQAQTEEDYSTWKNAIETASLTTPSSIERLLSKDSSTIPNSDKISGDSFDRDDVFHCDSSLTTIDVTSDRFIDSKINHIRRAHSAGGIDRLRSLHQGYLVYSKRKQSPLRRTISNVISSLDLAPKKRRSKTFGGLSINAALLVGIKYSSSVYLRVTKELWVQQWCVIQDNNLHFFVNADDLTPNTSIRLAGCKVDQVNLKGKNCSFKLSVPAQKTDFYFAVDSDQERKAWVELLHAEGQKKKQESKTDRDLLNGMLLSRVKSESNISPTATTNKTLKGNTNTYDGKTLRSMSRSLNELRKISQQGKENSSERNGSVKKSSGVLTQRPTSLQEVLKLLQEQQLMQSMGHQRYVRVKKARGNWKKSAAAVLKDAHSNPESPEAPRKTSIKRQGSREKSAPDTQRKLRGASTGSSQSNELNEAFSNNETSDDYLGKKAEEEKLKALKTETLLRKRRNSLSLEKDVLEKKLGKTQEKKTGVKKLLGKEVPKDKEEIIRTKKRIDEIKIKLADVDQDMQENKSKEAAVMENLTALKTKSLRKASGTAESLMSDHTYRSLPEERRAKYRESPTGSTSSRDSFEDKSDVYRPTERSASLHRKGSKNKTSQATLMALEEELLKISPYPTRKKQHRIVKRVSSSSEGSVDEYTLKLSPTTHRTSLSDVKTEGALSQSHDKLYGWDNVELKKKRNPTGSPQAIPKSEFRSVAVSIPTDASRDEIDGSTASSVSKSSEHRPSLITALSQIKDFEEFLEINRRR